MIPISYHCVAYTTPLPADLLASATMVQQNLTVPPQPAQIAAAKAVQGAVFLDYESAAESGMSFATAEQLRGSFAAAKTDKNYLGWYAPPSGYSWSPLWQAVYPPMVTLADDLRRYGACDALDFVAVPAYSTGHAANASNAERQWLNQIVGGLAVARIIGKPGIVFLSPRANGGQGPAEDGDWFVAQCVHVRGLIDAGLVAGACLWDFGPTPNTTGATPWTGDVLSNITWGWKKFIEAA